MRQRVSRLTCGTYTKDRLTLRRVTPPLRAKRSRTVITVVYARLRSRSNPWRTSFTLPSPSVHRTFRHSSSSGGGISLAGPVFLISIFVQSLLKLFSQYRKGLLNWGVAARNRG